MGFALCCVVLIMQYHGMDNREPIYFESPDPCVGTNSWPNRSQEDGRDDRSNYDGPALERDDSKKDDGESFAMTNSIDRSLSRQYIQRDQVLPDRFDRIIPLGNRSNLLKLLLLF